jgi:DNA polymerase III subunit delta'
MILPWHHEVWERLAANLERLPHALLFVGASGGGKRLLAEALAQIVLCEGGRIDRRACGKCPSCLWLAAGSHPDFRLLAPESEAYEDESDVDLQAESSTAGGKKKRPSKQIVIDQVRALAEFVAIGTHRRGSRVVIVDPVEAMNTYTANALLKLLEEPTPSTLFLMITNAPRRLLPTIRSRCQTITLAKPDAALARDWLEAQKGGGKAESLLAFAGGMPLAAAELAGPDAMECRSQFVAALSAIDRTDPLQPAAVWEKWVGQKGDGSFVPRLETLVTWAQKWLFDLALCKMSGRVMFHPEAKADLERLARAGNAHALLSCYTEMSDLRRVGEQPLNARLFLENMLILCARAVFAGASKQERCRE